MTTYVIFKLIKRENEDVWTEVAFADASSCRRALAQSSLGAGRYVAVPERSWKPLDIKVEQTTKVTIG